MENGKSEIFNCGYGKGYSVKEVLESFSKVLGKKINFEIGPRRDGDSEMVVANSDKFNKFLIGNQNLMILNSFLRQLLIGKKKLNDTKNIFDFFKLISAG